MEELLLEHMGKGFILMLTISMPCVLMAAAIGLIVGILQAVTQIQEQTIAAAPKIFAVFLVLMIGGGTFTQMLVNFFIESSHVAFNVITKDDNFALSANDTLKPYVITDGVQKDGVKEIMKQPAKDGYPTKAEKVENVVNPGSAMTSKPNIAETVYMNSKR